MSIAYLVLAHNQPGHLHKLVRFLQDNDSHIFVHVDATSDIGPFREPFQGNDNVTFLEDRENVRWGGFSIVRATLTLLHEATARPGFRRYCLLSGADFPIKSKTQIRERLDGNVELLHVNKEIDLEDNSYQAYGMNRYHLNDLCTFHPGDADVSSAGRFAREFLYKVVVHLGRLARRRRFVSGMTPYHGSQWWCLTDECVRYVLDFVSRNPDYVRFFRFVRAPDEVFFQTIIKASPFGDRISHDFEKCPLGGNDCGGHYVVWDEEANALPKVLDETDFEDLVKSRALFARKFDETVSKGLIEMVEKRISAAETD